MEKEKKVFKLLKLFINTLYIIFIYVIVDVLFEKVGFDEWFNLEFKEFIGKYLLFIIILLIVLLIVNYISVIWHELGHLLFGLKLKLNFVSFNIFNITIYKEKDKLKIKKSRTLKGIQGFCNMAFDDNIKYKSKDVISYFFGGILFNMIFVLLFSIMLLLCKNDYMYLLCLVFISTNVYLAFYNMIPVIKNNGVRSDMMQIMLFLDDDEFTKVYGKIYKIQDYLENGNSLKNIDKKLLYMPEIIKSKSSLIMSEIYIDYLIDIEKYEEAIEKIEYIKEKAKDLIFESDKYILDSQLIICLFKINRYKEIEKIWEKKYEKYIEYVENLDLVYLLIEYIYYKLVKNNKKEYEKVLSKFNKNKKYYKEDKIDEMIKSINEVDKIYESNL